MGNFQTLTPEEARQIEERAVQEYFDQLPARQRPEQIFQPHEHNVIVKIKAIFPFQLFPDELIIYKDKVTIVTRTGPGMSQTKDMNLHDIAQVEADVGPIFGHLHVIPKLRTEEPILIDRLSRREALRAREIIEDMIEEDLRGKRSYY